MYKKLREPINSITHFAGAGLSFIALIAMLIKALYVKYNTIFDSCHIICNYFWN